MAIGGNFIYGWLLGAITNDGCGDCADGVRLFQRMVDRKIADVNVASRNQ